MTFVRSDSKTEFLFNYRAVPIWIRVYAHGVEIRMQSNHLLVQQPVNVSIVMCERVKSTRTKLGARANNRCSRRQLCRYFFLQTQFSRQIGECLYGRQYKNACFQRLLCKLPNHQAPLLVSSSSLTKRSNACQHAVHRNKSRNTFFVFD